MYTVILGVACVICTYFIFGKLTASGYISLPSSSHLNRVQAFINPVSGSKKGRSKWKQVECALSAIGVTTETHVTSHSGHIAQLVQQTLDTKGRVDLDPIVVGGGDGFVYTFINALKKCRLDPRLAPFVVLPCGTGNGLAKSAGITCPADTAHALAQPEPTKLDLMEVRLTYSDTQAAETQAGNSVSVTAALSVAWGFVADLDYLSEGSWRSVPGRQLLVPFMLWVSRTNYCGTVSFTPAVAQDDLSDKYHLNSDGEVVIKDSFCLVQVCNTPWIADDVHFAPGSRLDDGRVAVVIVRGHISRWEMFKMFFMHINSGAHISQKYPCEIHWATKVRITQDHKLSPTAGCIVLDGEEVGFPSCIDVSVSQGAARMFCNKG